MLVHAQPTKDTRFFKKTTRSVSEYSCFKRSKFVPNITTFGVRNPPGIYKFTKIPPHSGVSCGKIFFSLALINCMPVWRYGPNTCMFGRSKDIIRKACCVRYGAIRKVRCVNMEPCMMQSRTYQLAHDCC